jgi:hypothetical protein
VDAAVVGAAAVVAVVESASVADAAAAAVAPGEAAVAVAVVAAGSGAVAASAKFKPPLKSDNKSPSHVLGGRGRFASFVHRELGGRTLTLLQCSAGVNRKASRLGAGTARDTHVLAPFRPVALVSGFSHSATADVVAVLSLRPEITFPRKRRPT